MDNISKYIGSVVRTGLAVASGYLLHKGISVPPEAVEALGSGITEVVSAVATFGFVQIWSIFQKKNS